MIMDEECKLCHKIRRMISESHTFTIDKDELVEHLEDLERFKRATLRNGKK